MNSRPEDHAVADAIERIRRRHRYIRVAIVTTYVAVVWAFFGWMVRELDDRHRRQRAAAQPILGRVVALPPASYPGGGAPRPLPGQRILILEGAVRPSQDLAGARIAAALVTDADGRFVRRVPPGEYTIVIDLEGGARAETEIVIDGTPRGAGTEDWPVLTVRDRPVTWELRTLDRGDPPASPPPLPPPPPDPNTEV